MVASLEECAEDGVTLISMLKADTFQVFVEDILGFAHSFASWGRVIVNSSLQHQRIQIIGASEGSGTLAQLKMKFIFN